MSQDSEFGDIGTQLLESGGFKPLTTARHAPRLKCTHRWITFKKHHSSRIDVLLLQTCRRCGAFRQATFCLKIGERLTVEGRVEFLKVEEGYRVLKAGGEV